MPRADALLALPARAVCTSTDGSPSSRASTRVPFFTFEPSAAPFAHLADFSPAVRAQSGDALSGTPPIAVSGDGRWLLSGGHADCTLRCTLLARSDVVVRARQHAGVITCVDVGADGVTIVTGAADTTVVVRHLSARVGASRPPSRRRAPSTFSVATAAPSVASRSRRSLTHSPPPPTRQLPPTAAAARRRDVHRLTAAKGRFVRRLALPGAPRAVAVSHTDRASSCTARRPRPRRRLTRLGCSLSLSTAWPLRRVPPDAPLNAAGTRNGELVVGAEGGVPAVRRLHDLQLLHRYEEVGARGADGAPARVSAFALSGENHHAFAATDGGGMVIYVNPLVNVAELERLASELLNL